jgi:hypothetical protein
MVLCKVALSVLSVLMVFSRLSNSSCDHASALLSAPIRQLMLAMAKTRLGPTHRIFSEFITQTLPHGSELPEQGPVLIPQHVLLLLDHRELILQFSGPLPEVHGRSGRPLGAELRRQYRRCRRESLLRRRGWTRSCTCRARGVGMAAALGFGRGRRGTGGGRGRGGACILRG